MSRNTMVGMVAAVASALFAVAVAAQVSAPTAKDMEAAPPGVFPSTGPRDLTGAYTSARRAGGADGAVAGNRAPNAPGVAPVAAADSAGQTVDRSCIPDFVAGIGAGYPTHVVTGSKVIVIAQEENHLVRRIYLDGEHPRDLQPTIFGHSIGRWEGDTLVVETVGLKSGLTVVERIRKVDGGRRVETTVDGRAMLADWRPELTWVEHICEAAGEPFGPPYQAAGAKP
jgi:hypothetical protein